MIWSICVCVCEPNRTTAWKGGLWFCLCHVWYLQNISALVPGPPSCSYLSPRLSDHTYTYLIQCLSRIHILWDSIQGILKFEIFFFSQKENERNRSLNMVYDVIPVIFLALRIFIRTCHDVLNVNVLWKNLCLCQVRIQYIARIVIQIIRRIHEIWSHHICFVMYRMYNKLNGLFGCETHKNTLKIRYLKSRSKKHKMVRWQRIFESLGKANYSLNFNSCLRWTSVRNVQIINQYDSISWL